MGLDPVCLPVCLASVNAILILNPKIPTSPVTFDDASCHVLEHADGPAQCFPRKREYRFAYGEET